MKPREHIRRVAVTNEGEMEIVDIVSTEMVNIVSEDNQEQMSTISAEQSSLQGDIMNVDNCDIYVESCEALYDANVDDGHNYYAKDMGNEYNDIPNYYAELSQPMSVYTDKEVQCKTKTFNQSIQCDMDCDNRSFLKWLKTDDDLLSWTNIPSFKVLNAISQSVLIAVPTELKKIDISLEAVIVLVFVKLKLNLPFVNMATLFGKSATSVSNYFHYMLPILKLSMSPLVYWPSSEEIKANMPKCFSKFLLTRVVLDCFETKMATLQCLTCRILTYSHYKKGHTVKILLGVTPAGQISFVSKPYCGRASDKLIFNHEKFLENHEFDAYVDCIMVDKGFFIEDECASVGIKLIRPPFLRKPATQLSKEDAALNVEIAKARVHVERAIQRIRTFQIFNNKLDCNILPWVDDIANIVCCMVNLSNPILAEDRF